jgi:tetratricopeptide (TPR) repeat protein
MNLEIKTTRKLKQIANNERFLIEWAESYLMRSAQLWDSEDYQEAIADASIPLEKYPGTPAGKQAYDQIAEIYVDWAADLQSNRLYQEAVEKITLVLDEYPDTPVVDNPAELATEIYYDWASYLHETEDFQESIVKYEIILNEYSENLSPTQIKEDIKSSYLAWGAHLRETGQYNLAITKYQTFQDEYPQTSQLADTAQLIIKTQLEWGEDLTQQNEFTQALDKFTQIKDLTSDPALVEAAEEGYQEALWGLSQDEGPEGEQVLSEAFTAACDGDPAPSPAVGLAEDEPAKARSCSSDLKLQQDHIAVYPGHFQYVVSRSDGYATVQTCPYQQGHSLIRQQQYWTITVRSTVTGNIYTSKKFYGSQPAKCEKTELFSGSTKYKYGTEPSLTEVSSWLASLFR